MATLRVIGAPSEASERSDGPPPHRRWPWILATLLVALFVFSFWIWAGDADTREIRALPDGQRLTLFHRVLDDLRNTCDPAPPRSLRDFCRQQAALALKFRECEQSPACQELARRHASQPRR
jgi:hypothetical protein